jgi:hypothetical protein
MFDFRRLSMECWEPPLEESGGKRLWVPSKLSFETDDIERFLLE